MMVKKMYQLMLIMVVGLVPTTVVADECVRKWHNQTAHQIAEFQLWAQSWAAYEPRRERYNARALAKAILENHVRPNCSAQLEALGLDEDRYLDYLISKNFTTSTGRIPQHIPLLTFMRRLEGEGLYFGLPQMQRQAPPVAEQRRVAPAQPKKPAPARRAPLAQPKCSDCPRGGA